MRVLVSAGAKLDIAESYAFYEKQSPGWGGYFRKCILQDLSQLKTTAGIHRKISGFYHVKSEVFNAILYYRVEIEEVIVVAILDGRAHPANRDRVLSHR